MLRQSFKFAFQILANLLNPSKLSVCRFHPSCSHYANEAIDCHGPWTGSLLIFRRLIKCNPWGASGLDPVPAPRKSQR